jgi:hypothetical protein
VPVNAPAPFTKLPEWEKDRLTQQFTMGELKKMSGPELDGIGRAMAFEETIEQASSMGTFSSRYDPFATLHQDVKYIDHLSGHAWPSPFDFADDRRQREFYQK